jgi:hypothetical protein
MRTEILELLAWVAREPRTYPDTVEVWRTSCPQHAVWEDALGEQLIEVVRNGSSTSVTVTARGEAVLERAERSTG